MTRVITKIKLTQVTVQMLFSYMVVYTVYATLENRKEAFDGVYANEHVPFFASEDLLSVANRAVTAGVLLESAIARTVVRHYADIWRYVFLRNLFESLAS